MRTKEQSLWKYIDWTLVITYLVLVLIGWINIYASVHSSEPSSIFDPACRSGKQFIWFGISLCVGIFILFVLNPRLYEGISLPFYIFTLVLLLAVIFLGTEVKGSRSWFEFGPVRFQPAEISKISTSLLLATIMSQFGFKMGRAKDFITVAAVIVIPMLIIVGQSETGSALVYVGFAFVLYREGLSGWLIVMIGMAIASFIITLTSSSFAAIMFLAVVVSICDALYTGRFKFWLKAYLPFFVVMGFVPLAVGSIISAVGNPESWVNEIKPVYILIGGIAVAIPFIIHRAYMSRRRFTILALLAFLAGVLLVFSCDFIFNDVLQDHQRKRIEVLLGMKEDPSGVGYNVNQSLIAIGSGGLVGKGFLNGTQTTFGFVPEQSTDFIFCTVGEEWGFVGSVILILLFVFLIWRIIHNAEQSREAFTRIYGYCTASCIFMHLFINIGMTLGLMPVIGIPLPFISYGGSSLLAFTTMLFIFIAVDANERRSFR